MPQKLNLLIFGEKEEPRTRKSETQSTFNTDLENEYFISKTFKSILNWMGDNNNNNN